MPEFAYVCGAGHETLRFFHMNDEKPRKTRCQAKDCRRLAKRALPRVQIDMDPGAQFSDSAGHAVRSRRHWNELIRQSQDTEQPFQQYERVTKKPDRVVQKPARRLTLDRAGFTEPGHVRPGIER